MRGELTKKEYMERISKRIRLVMEKENINQAKLLTMAKNHGYDLRQSTLSKILSDSASMNIPNIVQIANTLNVNLNDLLSESDSLDVRTYQESEPTSGQSRLIRRSDSLEMRPYLNSYYTYFFPTPSSSGDSILSGRIRFEHSEDKSKCIAKFSFETGKRDSQNKAIVKEYEGDLILSPTMSAAYCTLISEEIGEISYILFNYIPIIYEDLYCRVALVLTASAGANRMPTVHRMIITKEELTSKELSIVKGQLYLNKSEILISESGLESFLRDENLDESFEQYFCKPNQNSKLLGLSPVPYYCFDESVIQNSFLSPKVKNEAINLIRKYSASPKCNKIGIKCDDAVYKFITNAKKEEQGGE